MRVEAGGTFPIRHFFGKVSCSCPRRCLGYSTAAEVVPNILFGKVGAMRPPSKVPNADRRSREHLTPAEIDRLIAAAQRIGRHGQRDARIDFARLPARAPRLGTGQPTARAIGSAAGATACAPPQEWDAQHPPFARAGTPRPARGTRTYPETAYVFVSERHAPMTAATFRKLVARAGDAAKLGMPIHPHMLRHSTGFKLANDGQDTRAIQHYLGHKNIQHTVVYTQLASSRFNDFWRD